MEPRSPARLRTSSISEMKCWCTWSCRWARRSRSSGPPIPSFGSAHRFASECRKRAVICSMRTGCEWARATHVVLESCLAVTYKSTQEEELAAGRSGGCERAQWGQHEKDPAHGGGPERL